MKKIIVAVFILFFLAEAGYRFFRYVRGRDHVFDWYASANLMPDHHYIIFVGTSLIEAAIRNEVIETILKENGEKAISVLNYGRGNSTLQLHELGLRKLATKLPESSRISIFVPLHEGVPSYIGWQDAFAPDALTSHKLEVLDENDFFRILESGSNLEDRLAVAINLLASSFWIVRDRSYIWLSFTEKISGFLNSGLSGFFGKKLSNPMKVEIQSAPLIKILFPEKERNWEETSLAKILENEKVSTYFFHVPLSSHFKKALVSHSGYEKMLPQLNNWKNFNSRQAIFVAWKPDEESFPDTLHLDGKAAGIFSEILGGIIAEKFQISRK